MYKSEEENYAIQGRRAYLFAFRVREDFQNNGYCTNKRELQKYKEYISMKGDYK